MSMKLLYATSIAYPSELANRVQIFAMSEAFAKLLRNSFWLGALTLRDRRNSFQTFELKKAGRSPFLSWHYVWFIRREGITHVYCREDRLFFFMKMYARVFCPKVRFYFEAHSVRNDDRFFRFAARQANGLVAITDGIRRDLMAAGIPGEKILVEHDAVNIALFSQSFSKDAERRKLGIPRDAAVAAYIGKYTTMGMHKGVDEFIEAFAAARAKTPALQLLFVGMSASELPIVESVCDRAGIPAASRTLVTHVHSAEVPRYMRMSDMLVMNYPETTHYANYMSPMKLFEYMASRVAIVSSDLPAVREVLDEGEAFFVPPGDTAALTEMLVRVAADPAEAASRAERAYKKASRGYTWDKRAKSILDFIRSSADHEKTI